VKVLHGQGHTRWWHEHVSRVLAAASSDRAYGTCCWHHLSAAAFLELTARRSTGFCVLVCEGAARPGAHPVVPRTCVVGLLCLTRDKGVWHMLHWCKCACELAARPGGSQMVPGTCVRGPVRPLQATGHRTHIVLPPPACTLPCCVGLTLTQQLHLLSLTQVLPRA
jgi:hypothetical protein